MENEKKCSSTGVAILAAIGAFAVGIVVGFLLAPIKKGMVIGSYNGNCEVSEDFDDLWDLEDEEDGNYSSINEEDIDSESKSYSF